MSILAHWLEDLPTILLLYLVAFGVRLGTFQIHGVVTSLWNLGQRAQGIDDKLAGKLQFSFGANAVGVGTTSVSWMEAGMSASVGLQSTPRGHIALVDCDIYAATETCGTRDMGGGSTGTVLYAVFVDSVDSTKGLSVNLNTTAGVGIAMTPVTLGSVISVNAGQHIACLPRRVGAGTGRSNCTVTYYARAR